MASSPTLTDPQREAELTETGYTTLQLFGPEEVAALREEIAHAARDAADSNHSGIYASFLDTMAGDRLKKIAHRSLEEALRQHLQGGRLENAGIVSKRPGGERLAIHHHPPMTDAWFERELVCWCPLMDVDGTSGALRLIPRSHQLLPFIRLPKGRSYYDGFKEAVERYATARPMKAGEAIVFDNSLLHGSAPNSGTEPRYAISTQIVPEGARRGVYLPGEGDWLDFIETNPAEAYNTYIRTGARPPEWRVSKRFRNRNRTITETEFRKLLAAGAKATADFDPLDSLREAPQSPATNIIRSVGKFLRP